MAKDPGWKATIDLGTPAVVFAMGTDHYGHGCLNAIRTLGRMGVAVTGIHNTALTPPATSRYARSRTVIPTEAMPRSETLDRLLDIGTRLRRPVLVVTDDTTASFVDDHQGVLQERFRLAVLTPGLMKSLVDKAALHELCRKHGVPSPLTSCPSSREEAGAFAQGAQFPVIVKRRVPTHPRKRPKSSLNTVIAHNPAELLNAWDELEGLTSPNVLLQEYIRGGQQAAWGYTGYFGANGRCLFVGTVCKLRDYPSGRGSSSFARQEESTELADLASNFFRDIGYLGPVDTCWRRDSEGRFYLLDVNTRLGANFRAFTNSAGVDVVRAQYLEQTGQELPDGHPMVGRTWVAEPFDLWTTRELRRTGGLPRGTWLRTLLGSDELAYWAWDDPVPFLAMSALTALLPAYRGLIHTPWVDGLLQRRHFDRQTRV